jgi:hypothetical protein
MRQSHGKTFGPIIEPANYGSAGVDADSVNVGLLQRVTLAFLFGSLTGDSILTVSAGATAGAKTTALAFRYRLGAADYGNANADVLGAETDVAASGLTLTAATYDHREIVVELDPAELPAGMPWLTASINATATVMNVAAAVVGDPRFNSGTPATVL